jgi:hypothetical protein
MSSQLGVNDTLVQPRPLGAGETIEFRLGAIQVAGPFELYDISGDCLGSLRRDSALVVPGTYVVKRADGSTIEGLTLEAGITTEVQ